MDSISGGILLYMSLVDLIAEDYGNVKHKDNKGYMLLATAFGISVMGILALWAWNRVKKSI